MAYATPDDVQVRIGRALSGPEDETATALLGDAERILIHGVPDLVARADDPEYLARVVLVESAMVVRVLRNPGGYRTQAEGGATAIIDTRAAAGFLMVTPEEWALLRDYGTDSAVWTVAPGFPGFPGDWRDPWGGDVWRPLNR